MPNIYIYIFIDQIKTDILRRQQNTSNIIIMAGKFQLSTATENFSISIYNYYYYYFIIQNHNNC